MSFIHRRIILKSIETIRHKDKKSTEEKPIVAGNSFPDLFAGLSTLDEFFAWLTTLFDLFAVSLYCQSAEAKFALTFEEVLGEVDDSDDCLNVLRSSLCCDN